MNDTPIDPKLLQLLQKGEFDFAEQRLYQSHFSNWCQDIQSTFPFFRKSEIESCWQKVFSRFKKELLEQSLKLTETKVIGITDSLPVHLSNMVKRQIGKHYKKVSESSEDYRVIYAIQEHQDGLILPHLIRHGTFIRPISAIGDIRQHVLFDQHRTRIRTTYLCVQAWQLHNVHMR